MIDKRLTADEVANKRFTPVRLREGYSMDEVDAFLDEVESTLVSQEQELKELQTQLRERTGTPAPAAAPAAPSAPAGDDAAELIAELAKSKAEVARLERELADAKAKAAQPGDSSLTDVAGSATRMLEMAARQHDELIAQGKASGDKIVSEARGKADELLTDARNKVAEEQRRITEERTRQLGDLDLQRKELQAAVEHLRQLEDASRSALRDHFTKKLEELNTSVVHSVAGAAPARTPTPPSVPAAPAVPQASPEVAVAEEPSADGVPPKNYQEYPSFYNGPAQD